MSDVFSCLIWALLSISLAACGGSQKCPINGPKPTELLTRHQQGRDRIQSLRAEARVTYWQGSKRLRATVWMIVKQPNLVRMDVMTPLGPTAVFTVNDHEVLLTDMQARTAAQGPVCENSVGALLGLPLSAEALVQILSGGFRIRDSSAQLQPICDDGRSGVEVKVSDSVQRMIFEQRGRDAPRLVHASQIGPGQARWDVTYDDYRPLGYQLPEFPWRVEIGHVAIGRTRSGSDGSKRDERTVSVRFQKVEPNVQLGPHELDIPQDDIFTQTPPPHFRRMMLTCPPQ